VVESRSTGISEAVIRVNVNEEDVGSHLRRAFVTLFDLYEDSSPGVFELSATANVVLEGLDGLLSVYYGMDFAGGGGGRAAPTPVVIQRLSDVGLINTDYGVEDFERIFFANHSTSSVRVHSIISLTFIVRRVLGNYETDRAMPAGSGWKRIY
jgi:hypothetical protein